MSEDPQLIELAKAAQTLNDEAGITPDDLYELMADGIRKMPAQLQMMLDTLVSMQGEFPMPRVGWEAFVRDIQHTNEKHGLNLVIKPELLEAHNTAAQSFADQINKSIKTLEDTQ